MKINEEDYPRVQPSNNYMLDYVLGNISPYAPPLSCEYVNWAAYYLGSIHRFKPRGGGLEIGDHLLRLACEKYIKENNL